MNMRNSNEMYVVQDDELYIWYFSLYNVKQSDLSNLSFLNNLRKKLINFHLEYIDLSQQHRIGELIPFPLLQDKKIDLKEEYKNFLDDFYQTKENFFMGFFPSWRIDKLDIEIETPSSSLWLMTKDGHFKEDYFFSRKTGELSCLSDMMKSKEIILGNEILNSNTGGINLKYVKDDDNGMYFTISTFTDMWWETVCLNQSLFDDTDYERGDFEIDNRYVAYHNTPRLNSFIRDLIHLAVEKYGFILEPGHEEFKYGIPLDGKIICQEDIDEGRVKLPDIDSFGKIVEAGSTF